MSLSGDILLYPHPLQLFCFLISYQIQQNVQPERLCQVLIQKRTNIGRIHIPPQKTKCVYITSPLSWESTGQLQWEAKDHSVGRSSHKLDGIHKAWFLRGCGTRGCSTGCAVATLSIGCEKKSKETTELFFAPNKTGHWKTLFLFLAIWTTHDDEEDLEPQRGSYCPLAPFPPFAAFANPPAAAAPAAAPATFPAFPVLPAQKQEFSHCKIHSARTKQSRISTSHLGLAAKKTGSVSLHQSWCCCIKFTFRLNRNVLWFLLNTQMNSRWAVLPRVFVGPRIFVGPNFVTRGELLSPVGL